MKTIKQVVNEYKNRQKNPVYSKITIHPDPNPMGRVLTFDMVTNFNVVYDKKTGRWLVFDSTYNGEVRHIQIKGYVNELMENISEKNNIKNPLLIKKCANVIIYTHSGKRETFANIENLTENEYERNVEFDNNVAGLKTHVKMNGEIEMYEESIE